MGTAKFYFFPFPDGLRLETIDIGEGLAEFFTDMEVVANDGIGFDGSIKRSVGSIREVLTIQRDRMKLSEDLAHRFRSLQNHLDRGHSVAFSADSSKTFCGFTINQPTSGDTIIHVSGNPFFSMVGNNDISTNDYMTIETGNPGMITETRKVSANNVTSFSSGGSITVDPAISFSYPQGTFCHYYRFYPCLKRPLEDLGKNIITNEHGQLWSLDLRLVVDYELLFSFRPNIDSIPRDIVAGTGDLYGGTELRTFATVSDGSTTKDTGQPPENTKRY
tara:strand:+ start:120 stop:947 length:828 start_codon:yes stop_codon:yes gene_type:complete